MHTDVYMYIHVHTHNVYMDIHVHTHTHTHTHTELYTCTYMYSQSTLRKLLFQTMFCLPQHILANGGKHGDGVQQGLLISKLLGVRVCPVHSQSIGMPVKRSRAQVVNISVLKVGIPNRVTQALGANNLPTVNARVIF